MANNVLCLWMQTSEPWPELELLVKIVLNLYAPMILNVKKDPQCYMGPIHYFNSVQMAKNLLDNDKYQDYYQQVLKTMTFTSFWVHIESILLAMVMDKDPKVNAKAVKMIDKGSVGNRPT